MHWYPMKKQRFPAGHPQQPFLRGQNTDTQRSIGCLSVVPGSSFSEAKTLVPYEEALVLYWACSIEVRSVNGASVDWNTAVYGRLMS